MSHKVKATENEILSVNRISRKIFFFRNRPEKFTERLVPDLFLFFKNGLQKVKTSGL